MTRKKPLDLTPEAHARRLEEMREQQEKATEPKKYPSGASGKHTSPRFPMSGAPEEIAAWDAAAAAEGQSRTAWLRDLANAAVARRKKKQ